MTIFNKRFHENRGLKSMVTMTEIRAVHSVSRNGSKFCLPILLLGLMITPNIWAQSFRCDLTQYKE